jgi:hypothetical protein
VRERGNASLGLLARHPIALKHVIANGVAYELVCCNHFVIPFKAGLRAP